MSAKLKESGCLSVNTYGAVSSEQRGYQEKNRLDLCFRGINLAIKSWGGFQEVPRKWQVCQQAHGVSEVGRVTWCLRTELVGSAVTHPPRLFCVVQCFSQS